ncbi:Universal stress protein [Pseudomonas sp. XWY-1]|uniref:universal stress protein n=1 Tax=Pseudomonas TaxID=286 RepID=UPI000CDCC7C5|nr:MULTISPECIES: universal stress protein [unclassified Pseudomonas]QNV67494.1 universal stress protein [Pseudomonas sp. CFA]HEN8703910.1 universal stress protein [Pseudomonas putida]AUZ59223.1 Universal stress protein [Pseudomonas sp. XWY-1]MCX2812503.1 universal stress protein [Pseudomonas sp. DCB_E]MCX9140504.1 universal stress protein [Pseudomonas sp. DCB_Q]
MTPYRRILLIMTEAQANAALSRAMALSAASGASLHVLGIHESGALRLPHELQEAPLHSASFMHFSTELKALLDEQSFVGARPGFEAVETSNPRDQLPACIARYAPDLVIKGCPGHSLLEQIARTSLDQALLHGSETPLLFVPADAPAIPQNILVAVDVANPSPHNDALNHALVAAGQQLATQCKGQLHLLSAYDLPIAMLANPDLAGPWVNQLRESLQLPFDALADAHGIAYTHRHFSEGAPLRVIKSYIATLKIDAVVVGTVQPRHWAKVIGDTTERLVSHAPCSILTIRSAPAS